MSLCTIVCLGDSLTGPRPGLAYLHQYVKWSDLLQLAIENRSGIGSVLVHNSGWGGDKSSAPPGANPPGALQRLQGDVLDLEPQICILFIGCNNFAGQGEDPADLERIAAAFRLDLMALVERMEAPGIRVLLLQYYALRVGDSVSDWTALDTCNDVIASVASEHKLPLLPLEEAFAVAEADGASNASLVSPADGIHLNPFGELVIARAVAAKLRSLGWLPADIP